MMALWIVASLLSLFVLLFSLRYAWWRRAVDWRGPRILMYHMVTEHRPKARFNKLRVPPVAFEKQMRWLREQGFHFVFASDLAANELGAKSVCVTFDDGYQDNLLNADKVLAAVGGRATLYLVEEREGGWSSKKKAHHDDDELASEAKLSDEEVRVMLASGRWELGGHTKTHANLGKLPALEAFAEISDSRERLQRQFGCEVSTFAYPFGLYEQEHVAMAGEAGYQVAVTTEAGIMENPPVDLYQVPRIKVSGKEGLLGFVMRMRGGKRGWRK